MQPPEQSFVNAGFRWVWVHLQGETSRKEFASMQESCWEHVKFCRKGFLWAPCLFGKFGEGKCEPPEDLSGAAGPPRNTVVDEDWGQRAGPWFLLHDVIKAGKGSERWSVHQNQVKKSVRTNWELWRTIHAKFGNTQINVGIWKKNNNSHLFVYFPNDFYTGIGYWGQFYSYVLIG